MFIEIDEVYLNVNHVVAVEPLDSDECEVHMVSGDSFSVDKSAREVMGLIERRTQSG